MLAAQEVHTSMWVSFPGAVAILAAFLIFLFWQHPLRWVPFISLFVFSFTWIMLNQEDVVHGPVAVLIALVAAPTTVGLVLWLEAKGWVSFDGDGDAGL